MSTANRLQSNSVSAASLLRAFQEEKSVSLQNGKPFASTSEQQEESTKEFNVLDFTSPSPPPSPGIRPCNTILKGFGYSQPVLDFTNDLPPPAVDHTVLTGHLVLGEDQRGRSLSRSPGRVDYSPSPSTASSDNASSYLDRFSGSESEHNETRFQTPLSYQQKRSSPPPAPRKKYTQRDIRVRSEYGVPCDEYRADPDFADHREYSPLKVVLNLDTRLLHHSSYKEKVEEPTIERVQESPANKVMRPAPTGLRLDLGNAIFEDTFQMQREQLRGTVTLSEAVSDDRNFDQERDAERIPGFQNASNESLLIESPHPGVQDFGQAADETGDERAGASHDPPERVRHAEGASTDPSMVSANARVPCGYGCSRTWVHKPDRDYHCRHEHGTEMFECKYDGCDQKFLYREDLKKHMLDHGHFEPRQRKVPQLVTTEGSKKSFQCSECTASYARKGNLQRHMRDCHEKSQAGKSGFVEGFSDPMVPEQGQKSPDDVLDDITQNRYSSRAVPLPPANEAGFFECVYPNCKIRHTKYYHLEQHCRLMHKWRLYECCLCKEGFTRVGKQKQHEKGCRSSGKQTDEVGNSVEIASQPQIITPLELVKSSRMDISPTLPPPSPAGRKAAEFKCTICIKSTDPLTRRLADFEVFYQMSDLNKHHQDIHFSAPYKCSVCVQSFVNKHDYLSHTREAHKTYFDPFGPRILETGKQDRNRMSPFDHFQPPPGIRDPRLLPTPERDQVLNTVRMWTPGLVDEERHGLEQLEISISPAGQDDGAGKAAVVSMNPDPSQSSISSSLPSVGKLFSEWKNPARHGKVMDGSGEKGKMPDQPIPNVPRPMSGFGSNGGFDTELGDGTEFGRSEVDISGGKRKRMDDGSGDQTGSGLARDDHDSDEDLKFPSIKRKRMMNIRAMKILKEEGKLEVELIE
ncbi:zinc finger E-box-binding homeobox 1-like [Venturia nashicola]|nr:zinc finger E-box-binding homeobox 1-like [Venturia nashicola]